MPYTRVSLKAVYYNEAVDSVRGTAPFNFGRESGNSCMI